MTKTRRQGRGTNRLMVLLAFALAACASGPEPTAPRAEPPPPETSQRAELPAEPAEAELVPRAPLVIAAVGDIMLGTTYPLTDGRHLPPEDDRPAGPMTPFAEILRGADLAFGNLEGAILSPDVPRAWPKCEADAPGCFAFRMPPALATWLVGAGFDVLSLANNHALDFGPVGADETRRHLDALGIAHAGREGEVLTLERRGLRIAFLAAATDSRLWNINSPETLLAAITEAKAGHDIVLVSFHAGAEGAEFTRTPRGREYFIGRNRGHVRAFAEAAVAAGADLLLGHGPHVPRGLELIEGRLVAYSLGNFMTWRRFNLRGPMGLTYVLEVHLAPDGAFLGGQIHPGLQRPPGGPVVDPSGAVIRLLRELTLADFPSRGVRIGPDGQITPP